MDNKKETFQYTYSARQQEEINRIREKYLPQEESKMDQLRKLDQSTTKKGTLISVIAGVIGTLLFGTCMSCILVWGGQWFVPGIIIGVFGIAVVAAAYPLYNYITKKERERVAPQILKLTEELSKTE